MPPPLIYDLKAALQKFLTFSLAVKIVWQNTDVIAAYISLHGALRKFYNQRMFYMKGLLVLQLTLTIVKTSYCP